MNELHVKRKGDTCLVSQAYLAKIQRMFQECPDAEAQGKGSALTALAVAASAFFSQTPAKADFSSEIANIYAEGRRELQKLKEEEAKENAELGIGETPDGPLRSMFVPSDAVAKCILDLANQCTGNVSGGGLSDVPAGWTPDPTLPNPYAARLRQRSQMQHWSSLCNSIYQAAVSDITDPQARAVAQSLSSPEQMRFLSVHFDTAVDYAIEAVKSADPDLQRFGVAWSMVLCGIQGFQTAPTMVPRMMDFLRAFGSPLLQTGNLGEVLSQL